MVYIVIKL